MSQRNEERGWGKEREKSFGLATTNVGFMKREGCLKILFRKSHCTTTLILPSFGVLEIFSNDIPYF